MLKHTLKIQIFEDRATLGAAAARAIASDIRSAVAERGEARVIFAAAPSQQETLDALVHEDVPWSSTVAFHLDEYIGLPSDANASFRRWLQENLFDRVQLKARHLIVPDANPHDAASAYAATLSKKPIDVICCGIGVNGHIAFNDPPVADFKDPKLVKVVELDEVCRQQQVDDGAFKRLEEVPTSAVTLTIPALMAAQKIHCVVPGESKAEAVAATVTADISTAWPSTILRNHPCCHFYFDADAARLL